MKIMLLRENKSFTLVEIIASLLVLAVGLLGLLSVFPVGFDASRKANDLTEMTILAKDKLEDLKRLGYASLADDNGTFAGTSYDWDVDETLISTGLRRVDLTIRWTRRANNYIETFVTYMAE